TGRHHDRQLQDAVPDYELEQAARDPVVPGQAEGGAEPDAVGDQDQDRRHAAQHAEGEIQDRNPDVVGHDHARGDAAILLWDVEPELVAVHALHQVARQQLPGQVA